MTDFVISVRQNCGQTPVQLPRRAAHELHFVVRDGEDWLRVAGWAAQTGCDAVAFFVSDERALEANAFKLHLLLSTPDGCLIILEHVPALPGRPHEYLSVRSAFPNVSGWEQEIAELFGLTPANLPLPMTERTVLVGPYPPDLHPLRRTVSLAELRDALSGQPTEGPRRPIDLPEGVRSLSAGPIHAGVKEAGALRIQAAGETVEALEIEPGRKHRGIEKLFEARRLADGWQLAEVITGDAAFAHSLACCLAVEAIAGVNAPALAQNWRAALLELERIGSHIGNVATLIHDIALSAVAAPMSGLREACRQLNARLTGSRFLRGINRPGGVVLQPGLSGAQLSGQVNRLVAQFLALGMAAIELPACRDRLIGTGWLTADEARRCGASGVIRRACGDLTYDARLRHPFGVYQQPEIRAAIARQQSGFAPTNPGGDNFARLLLHIAEVEASARLVTLLASDLMTPSATALALAPIADALADAELCILGIGCVEGARGMILHCGMNGPGQRPWRWKYIDPSNAALCALSVAACYRVDASKRTLGDIVADVPLDNVSMNASLAAAAG